jgi:hypothetical protein
VHFADSPQSQDQSLIVRGEQTAHIQPDGSTLHAAEDAGGSGAQQPGQRFTGELAMFEVHRPGRDF